MPVPEMYMQKLIVAGAGRGGDRHRRSGGRQPPGAWPTALGRRHRRLTVVVLDRPRHEDLIAAGPARGRPAQAHPRRGHLAPASRRRPGDAASHMYHRHRGVDGGHHDRGRPALPRRRDAGTLLACLASPGGAGQGRRHRGRRGHADHGGHGRATASCSSATAVTGGRFLQRRRRPQADGIRTETLIMCSSCHTVRTIKTLHRTRERGPQVRSGIS